MPTLRDDVVRLNRVVAEKAAVLVTALEWHALGTRHVAEHIEAGESAIAYIEGKPIAEVREGITVASRQFDRARHAGRIATMALLRSEGMRPADIARLYGLSRQMVAKHLEEWDSIPRQSPAA